MQMDFNLKKNSKLRADILSASEDALTAATLVRFSAEVRHGRPGAGSHERIRHGIPYDRVEYRAGLPSEHLPRPDTCGHERMRVRVRWQELATDEKRKEREEIEKKMKRECQRGTEAGQATTDQFKCGRCGQRKVWRHKPCNMQHVLPSDCVQPEHRVLEHGESQQHGQHAIACNMQHTTPNMRHTTCSTQQQRPIRPAEGVLCGCWRVGLSVQCTTYFTRLACALNIL